MKKIKTDSYFVTICETKNRVFIRRKKRKGLHAYPRTLSLKKINKCLRNTKIKYPKLLKNNFKYVDEEFIESTKDINVLSNLEIIDNIINYIVELNQINIKSKKIIWKNNSEFFRFIINNLKKVLILKNPEKLEIYLRELENLYKDLDNNRKLCFIHGDIHKRNIIINNSDFYLIDWELATYGDLAYELATHFILMEYSEEEINVFLNKLNERISFDIESLKSDINAYTLFEMYRRKILKEIKNSKI